MPRQVQSSLSFVVRKSPRVTVKGESPFERKLEKLRLKTPTPIKIKPTDENGRASKPSPRISRNLFDDTKDIGEVGQGSPPKLRKLSEENYCSASKHGSKLESPYERAKLLLNSSHVENLVFRDDEYKQINDFIEDHVSKRTASSMYISGAPGTGKTLCVENVIHKLRKAYSFKYISINCMDCRTPSSIYSKIVDVYGLKSPKTPLENLEVIEKRIVTPNKGKAPFTVLVLDEVDKLESKSQEVLYTLFDLPRTAQSKLLLIGIANTLDFTTRALSRFHSFKLNDVTELNFQPYTKEQVKGIVESRLKQIVTRDALFNATSLELCARKVATHSGDVRKALHVCRRAIELAESEARSASSSQKAFLRITNDDGQNPGSPRKRRNADNDAPIKQVTVAHIMKVLNEVYGSKTITVQSGAPTLPTQQQIILCSLLLFAKYRSRREVEVTKCYQIFSRICNNKSIGFDMGNNSEFLSMCQSLDSKGYVSVKVGKETAFAKLALSVNEEDIEAMMTDKNLFKSILSDSSHLNC